MSSTSHSKLTPNDLDVLIHYYTTPGAHPRIHASAVHETVGRFIREGVLKSKDGKTTLPLDASTLELTEMGVAWLNLILSTPYPIQKWIDPRTEREVDSAR